jgi:hypothetical protein
MNTPLTQKEKQFLAQRMNDELNRMIMSWDNDLKQWHTYAMQALCYSSAAELQVPQARYGELLKTDNHGVNMNVVMVLCNNLENRTPAELGYSVHYWAKVLQLNANVATRWQDLQAPVQKKVEKEFDIMRGKPKLVMVPGEA